MLINSYIGAVYLPGGQGTVDSSFFAVLTRALKENVNIITN
jgi:hypothetical protein